MSLAATNNQRGCQNSHYIFEILTLLMLIKISVGVPCDAACLDTECDQSVGYCTKCKPGYQVSAFNATPILNTCDPCLPHCLDCSADISKCMAGMCQPGYLPKTPALIDCGKCDDINPGYGKNQESWPTNQGGSCPNSCTSDCRRCFHPGCMSCADNFKQCQSDGCVYGFKFITDLSKQHKKQNSIYLQVNQSSIYFYLNKIFLRNSDSDPAVLEAMVKGFVPRLTKSIQVFDQSCLCVKTRCCTQYDDDQSGCNFIQGCSTTKNESQKDGQCLRCLKGWIAPEGQCNQCDILLGFGADPALDPNQDLYCKPCDYAQCGNCGDSIHFCVNCKTGYVVEDDPLYQQTKTTYDPTWSGGQTQICRNCDLNYVKKNPGTRDEECISCKEAACQRCQGPTEEQRIRCLEGGCRINYFRDIQPPLGSGPILCIPDSLCLIERCSKCKEKNPRECDVCFEGYVVDYDFSVDPPRNHINDKNQCIKCPIAFYDSIDPIGQIKIDSSTTPSTIFNKDDPDQLPTQLCITCLTQFECSICQQGYMPDLGKKCRPLCDVHYCEICSPKSPAICSICKQNYFPQTLDEMIYEGSALNQVYCYACDILDCETCNEGLVTKYDDLKCVQCRDGFSVSIDGKNCLKCENYGCQQCDEAGECFQCLNGFTKVDFMKSIYCLQQSSPGNINDSDCARVMPGCEKCVSQTNLLLQEFQCTQCETLNYFLNSLSHGWCIQKQNIFEETSEICQYFWGGHCSFCKLNSPNLDITCSCNQGYGEISVSGSSSQRCVPKNDPGGPQFDPKLDCSIENCAQCSIPNFSISPTIQVCSKCSVFYQLGSGGNSGVCVPYTNPIGLEGCLMFQDIAGIKCKICSDYYQLDTSTGLCNQRTISTGQTCWQTVPQCLRCTKDIGTIEVSCLECSEGLIPNFGRNQCITQMDNCERGYFYDLISQKCLVCDSKCRECTQRADQCKFCSNNRDSPPFCGCIQSLKENLIQNPNLIVNCLNTCVDGSFWNPNTSSCQLCSLSNCLSCTAAPPITSSSSPYCILCEEGYIVQVGGCVVAPQPSDFGIDSQPSIQKQIIIKSLGKLGQNYPCPSGCHTCQYDSTMGEFQCIECEMDGLNMLPNDCQLKGSTLDLGTDPNQCTPSSKYYPINSAETLCDIQCSDAGNFMNVNNRCVRLISCAGGSECDTEGCQTAYEESDREELVCTTCQKGFYHDELRRCIKQESYTEDPCPSFQTSIYTSDGQLRVFYPFFYRTGQIKCLLCPLGCLSCQFAVNDRSYFNFDSPESETGVLVCSEQKCADSLKSCTNDSDCDVTQSEKCTICDQGYEYNAYFLSCVQILPFKQCELEYFYSQIEEKCLICDASTTTQCNTQASKCPEGYYFEQTLLLCEQCPENCLQCNLPTHCDQCQENFIATKYGTCQIITNCGDSSSGFALEKSLNKCFQCSEFIANCQSCSIQLLLYNFHYNFQEFQPETVFIITNQLPQMSYSDGYNRRFRVICNSCMGSQLILSVLNDLMNTCIDTSKTLCHPTDEYIDYVPTFNRKDVQICQQCPPKCRHGCEVGPSPFSAPQCKTCEPGYYPTYFADSLDGFPKKDCQRICSFGFFFVPAPLEYRGNPRDQPQPYCKACTRKSCIQCVLDETQVDMQKCIQCQAQYLLVFGVCISKLDADFHFCSILSTAYSEKSKKCQCLFGMHFDIDRRRCVGIDYDQYCPPGSYPIFPTNLSRDQCLTCYVNVKDPHFPHLIVYVSGICTRCQSQLKCLQCKDGYYLDSEKNECVLCQLGCQTCSSREFCKICLKGFKLVTSQYRGNQHLKSDCQMIDTCPKGTLPKLSSYFEMNPDCYPNIDPSFYFRQSHLKIQDQTNCLPGLTREAVTSGGFTYCQDVPTQIPTCPNDFRLVCEPCLFACTVCVEQLIYNPFTDSCVQQCPFPMEVSFYQTSYRRYCVLIQKLQHNSINHDSSQLTKFRGFSVNNIYDELLLSVQSTNPQNLKFSWKLQEARWVGMGDEILPPKFSQLDKLSQMEYSEIKGEFYDHMILQGSSSGVPNSQFICKYGCLRPNVAYLISMTASEFDAVSGNLVKENQVSIVIAALSLSRIKNIEEIADYQVYPQKGLSTQTIFTAKISLFNEVFAGQSDFATRFTVYPMYVRKSEAWQIVFDTPFRLQSHYAFRVPIIFSSSQVVAVDFQVRVQQNIVYRGTLLILIEKPPTLQYKLPQLSKYALIKQKAESIINDVTSDPPTGILFEDITYLTNSAKSLYDEIVYRQINLLPSKSPLEDDLTATYRIQCQPSPDQAPECSNRGMCVQYQPDIFKCLCDPGYQTDYLCRLVDADFVVQENFNYIVQTADITLTVLAQLSKAFQQSMNDNAIVNAISSLESLTQIRMIESMRQLTLYEDILGKIAESVVRIPEIDAALRIANNILQQMQLNDLNIFLVSSNENFWKNSAKIQQAAQNFTLLDQQEIDVVYNQKRVHQKTLFQIIRQLTIALSYNIYASQFDTQGMCKQQFCAKLFYYDTNSIISDVDLNTDGIIDDPLFDYIQLEIESPEAYSNNQDPFVNNVNKNINSAALMSVVKIPKSTISLLKDPCIGVVNHKSKNGDGIQNMKIMTPNFLDVFVIENCGKKNTIKELINLDTPVCFQFSYQLFASQEPKYCTFIQNIDQDPVISMSKEGCVWNDQLFMCCCNQLNAIFAMTTAQLQSVKVQDQNGEPVQPDFIPQLQNPIDPSKVPVDVNPLEVKVFSPISIFPFISMLWILVN